MVKSKPPNQYSILHLIIVLLGSIFCMHSSGMTQTLEDMLDPLDPFSSYFERERKKDSVSDKNKTAEELIREAITLQGDQRYLDSRTKLLRALKKNPKAYQAHMYLADYYQQHVNHFRLALKYAKRSRQLFKEKHGAAPYSDPLTRMIHSQLLNLHANIRLNLDDYEGALKILEEYESYGYYETWLPSSKAWVLFKLGKIDEAIQVARTGMLFGANPGHTLNILGILLSTSGKRDNSISVFKKAIQYENSLGQLGRPATPLNNVGEVYKEIFQEDNAEKSWKQATLLPDGCEHVLPSLNLALLYIEEHKLDSAKQVIDQFESCVAQYPLRNGEEHRALVHMARGRIAMHSGNINKAVEHLLAALKRQQWFGKIGTSQHDLQAAVMISYAQALRAQNNHLETSRFITWSSWIESLKTRSMNSIRSWWYLRRARQILAEELNHLEDLHIRNTDSMLEYPTLGDALVGFPLHTLKKRINGEQNQDPREVAQTYYEAYIAQKEIRSLKKTKARTILKELIQKMRPKYDRALRTQLLVLLIGLYETSSAEYPKYIRQVFQSNPAAIRNHGLRLPVNFANISKSTHRELRKTTFLLDNSRRHPYRVEYEFKDHQYIMYFRSAQMGVGDVRVKGADLKDTVNNFVESVFSEDL